MSRPSFGQGAVAVAALLALVFADGASAYSYDVPVQRTRPGRRCAATAATPGTSPIRARYDGGRPWRFRTGRGIFSTPVIGGDGTVYVGSADHDFYALRPDGRLRWKLHTGGIIDAAAAIGAYDRRRKTLPITIGSGDEHLYHLRGDGRRLSRARQGDLELRARPCRPRSASRSSTGGRATSRSAPTRPSTPATPAAAPTRSTRVEPSAGSIRPATRSGRPRPSGPAGSTYWGSVDLHAFALEPERPAALEPGSRRLRHLLAGDRQRRHRLRRRLRPPPARDSTPTPAATGGASHRRAHLRLAGAR